MYRSALGTEAPRNEGSVRPATSRAESRESEQIARLRGAYAGFVGGDSAVLLDALHDEVLWDASSALLHTGTYCGHEGVLDYLRRFSDYWEEFLLEPDDFREHGDLVVVTGTVLGRARQSHTLITAPFTHYIRLDEHGQVTELRVIVGRTPDPGPGPGSPRAAMSWRARVAAAAQAGID